MNRKRPDDLHVCGSVELKKKLLSTFIGNVFIGLIFSWHFSNVLLALCSNREREWAVIQDPKFLFLFWICILIIFLFIF